MKDFMTFLVLLILCILIDEPVTKSVFSESERQDVVKNYYLEIEDLNTNNFKDYFSNIEVISVVVYVNPIYEDKLINFYIFNDINKLRKDYITNLKQKGYYQEANKYILRPIPIKKVLVNASLNDIYNNLANKEYNIIDI